MSPGTETDLDSMFLAQTASNDYEELYRMDVLGLEDTPNGDQSVVYAEFHKQLRRSPDGWYETRLPWKGDHPPLPSNESGSLTGESSTTSKENRSTRRIRCHNPRPTARRNCGGGRHASQWERILHSPQSCGEGECRVDQDAGSLRCLSQSPQLRPLPKWLLGGWTATPK